MNTLHARILPLLPLLACLGLSPAFAQPNERPALGVNDGEYVMPLGWLNQKRTLPLDLRGAGAEYGLKLPIPARLQILESRLELIYTNSISLLPRSQLAVMLDGRIQAQLPIRADRPDNAARLNLPLTGMKPGYHDLGFRAAHHYTDECEDPSAPELYSQVDAMHSVLRIKTRRKPVTTSLARLIDVFDKRLWAERYDLGILTPPGRLQQNETMRKAASQISQAVASRFEFIPVAVHVHELSTPSPAQAEQDNIFPGLRLPEGTEDVVLLGTRDELANYLSPKILNRIQEGYIGLFPADEDPTRAVLLISGVTPEQVLQAATALNLPGLALPDRQDVLLSELTMDSGYGRARPMQVEEGWTSFAQLGFKNSTMHRMYPPPARLEFWAFREMLDPAQPFIEARVNFAYGSGFDKKSALNVLLNGQFVQSLPMQDKHGEQIWGAKVKIPTVALRPGNNVLEFVPSMIGEDVGGACEPIFTENLYVTVFEDSRIELPLLTDYLRLPDLGLLNRTGLPYTLKADGQGVGVLIGDTQPETINAALTLMAKLRQVHASPFTAIRMLTPQDSLEGLEGLIVVGGTASLPETIMQEASAFIPGQRWQTIQVGTQIVTDLAEGSKLWLKDPLKPLLNLSKVEAPALAQVRLAEGLGRSAAMIQYVSPSLNIPVTLLTAADAQSLEQGSWRLIRDDTWAALEGSATIWSADGEYIAKAFPPVHEFIGDAPPVSPASYLLSDRPWLLVLLALGLVLLVASLSWWILRRRARRLQLEP
jgi:hypothetical protein